VAPTDPNPASATEPDFGAPPFDLLEPAQQERLRRALDIILYRAGERLIEAGQPSPCVFVLLKGRVLASDVRDGAERAFAEYAHGELFGAFAAIAGRARHRYAALEDTLAWTFPAPLFLELTQENPRFAAYFHESLAVKRRLLAERDQPSDLAELMLTRIRDALVLEPVSVGPQATIAEAVAAMRGGRTDAVLVDDGARRGIATRTDLLEALARGATRDSPIRHAMNPKPVCLTVDDSAATAAERMAEGGLKYLPVLDGGGQPVALLSSDDFVRFALAIPR